MPNESQKDVRGESQAGVGQKFGITWEKFGITWDFAPDKLCESGTLLYACAICAWGMASQEAHGTCHDTSRWEVAAAHCHDRIAAWPSAP